MFFLVGGAAISFQFCRTPRRALFYPIPLTMRPQKCRSGLVAMVF